MMKLSNVTGLGLFLTTFSLGAGACVVGGGDEADEIATVEPQLSALETTNGTWVNLGSDFGPCGALPATCVVGTQIDAHSGPGLAQGKRV
jgi:hypothetical protein